MIELLKAFGRKIDLPLAGRIAAGALIPSFAAIIFNYLYFFFENYKSLPPAPNSVFDIGVGCAFSLVGVCVGSQKGVFKDNSFIIFAILLLLLIAGRLFVVFGKINELAMIWFTNIVCFTALSWAIMEAE